jgi:hypothetical protein
MKKLKQVLRICVLAILVLLACTGVGIVGQFLPKNGEPYMNNEVLIELVEKKKDEDESESESEREKT